MKTADDPFVRILVVEDESKLANVLRLGLEEEGLAVDVVGNGAQALEAASATSFDVISLDVMLPGAIDGYSVSAELRRRHIRTPILMLTARDAVADRVRGLESGADDYLIKPFAFVEFLARIRALARRHLEDRSSRLEIGQLLVDFGARELLVAGRPVRLTAKEFSLLEYLVHHPRHVLSRRQIEEHVWNYDFQGGSNLVDVYVGRIRGRLKQAGAADRIVTLRGVGYRFDPAS
jgi:DNA-binding response OmpR family regulator